MSCWGESEVIEVMRVPLVLPNDFEERLGLDGQVLAYAPYWSPVGDEAIVEYLTVTDRQPLIVSHDVDFDLFFELEKLNPQLFEEFNFGSSDEEPEFAIAIVKKRRSVEAYVVGIEDLEDFFRAVLNHDWSGVKVVGWT